MKRVLVVEDDATVRRLLEELVWSLGLVPVPSGCVADAIVQVGPTIDLILLDLALPNGHGFEILEHVAERRNDIPVVVVSAYPQDPKHEPPVPIMAWIRKPFRNLDVVDAIESACRFSSSVTAIRESVARLERAANI